MDDDGAFSFKKRFVHFMTNWKHGRQIEDCREVRERFLHSVKTRTEPIDALRSYMELKLAQEIKRINKRRDPSPYKAPVKQTREESSKELNLKRPPRSATAQGKFGRQGQIQGLRIREIA